MICSSNFLFAADRLKDVHIEFGRTMEELTEIYYHSGEVGATLDIILEDEYTGQYLYIWLETDNGVLSICELEVNGKTGHYHLSHVAKLSF